MNFPRKVSPHLLAGFQVELFFCGEIFLAVAFCYLLAGSPLNIVLNCQPGPHNTPLFDFLRHRTPPSRMPLPAFPYDGHFRNDNGPKSFFLRTGYSFSERTGCFFPRVTANDFSWKAGTRL